MNFKFSQREMRLASLSQLFGQIETEASLAVAMDTILQRCSWNRPTVKALVRVREQATGDRWILAIDRRSFLQMAAANA